MEVALVWMIVHSNCVMLFTGPVVLCYGICEYVWLIVHSNCVMLFTGPAVLCYGICERWRPHVPNPASTKV
jgi:hypothetical protein